MKPLCDGTHRHIGFRETAQLQADALAAPVD
jgi:CDGSH-type Zn-finger protein